MLPKALRVLLEKPPGIKVIAEAADSALAVTLASDLKPDMAVMDPNMPGVEATRRMATAAGPGHPKVLVLSGHADGRRGTW